MPALGALLVLLLSLGAVVALAVVFLPMFAHSQSRHRCPSSPGRYAAFITRSGPGSWPSQRAM